MIAEAISFVFFRLGASHIVLWTSEQPQTWHAQGGLTSKSRALESWISSTNINCKRAKAFNKDVAYAMLFVPSEDVFVTVELGQSCCRSS